MVFTCDVSDTPATISILVRLLRSGGWRAFRPTQTRSRCTTFAMRTRALSDRSSTPRYQETPHRLACLGRFRFHIPHSSTSFESAVHARALLLRARGDESTGARAWRLAGAARGVFTTGACSLHRYRASAAPEFAFHSCCAVCSGLARHQPVRPHSRACFFAHSPPQARFSSKYSRATPILPSLTRS